LVEVTHSQNCCQLVAPWRCWRVVVMRTRRRVLPKETVWMDGTLKAESRQDGFPPHTL